jgi:predicted nucleic acid-binding protein
MIRIVVDTNVVVSGVLSDDGLPASILDLAANGRVLLVP